MFKAIALLTRKPGITREEFIDYYENIHAPLITETFPQIIEYRRNFPDLTQALRAKDAQDPTFDVITEMWFHDKAGYEDMLAAHARPDIGNKIRTDAAQFLDVNKIVQFVVDERELPRT